MDARAFLISFPVDFRIARSRILYSHHLLVTLATGDRLAAGTGVLYRSAVWQARRWWRQRLRPRLAALSPDDLGRGWQDTLDDLIPLEPGLAFAADAALWDLRGQQLGQPVAGLLGGVHHPAVPITEQIFIDDWRRSQTGLEAILARGTRRLKVKTGFGPRQDLDLLRRVRDLVGPAVELRVDANRAYTFDQAGDLYPRLAQLGVLAAEEPLRDSWAALRRLRETSGLPVMLDESVLTLHDLRQAIAARALDSLNIKLTRVGGLTAALAFRRLCDEAGVAVAFGCNEDLGPGMAAILHLSAATPNLYATEGLGHLRLGADLVDRPPRIVAGAVDLPPGAGLGAPLAPDWAARLAGRARVFDLDHSPAAAVRAFSAVARGRQRAANVLHRLGRRVGMRSG